MGPQDNLGNLLKIVLDTQNAGKSQQHQSYEAHKDRKFKEKMFAQQVKADSARKAEADARMLDAERRNREFQAQQRAYADSVANEQELARIALQADIAKKFEEWKLQQEKTASKTVSPEWSPDLYGMREAANEHNFFNETQGIHGKDVGHWASKTLGSILNPYSDSDIIAGYNAMQPVLHSDVIQAQKPGVAPEHKQDLVRFLIEAFNRVNREDFIGDDNPLEFWGDNDAQEKAIKQDIISKLIELDYNVKRDIPVGRKLKYK